MISFIIPSYEEWPRLNFTVSSLILNMAKLDGWHDVATDEYEIIIVNDGEVHPDFREWIDSERIDSKRIRAHNVTLIERPIGVRPRSAAIARTIGAEAARGDVLWFVDGHVLLLKESIPTTLKLLNDEVAEVVHQPSTSGGINPERYYSYKLTLEKDFWGSGHNQPVSREPYYVAAYAHNSVSIKKKDFMMVGGYNPNFDGYGGEEVYFNLKCWMMGLRTMINTHGHAIHIDGPHQYRTERRSWDLSRNLFLGAYVLGGESWLKRLKDRFLRERLAWQEETKIAVDSARIHGEEERLWIEENAKMTLEEVLDFFSENDIPR